MSWNPGQPVPMTAEVKGQWTSRLERAERKAKLFHPQWERALNRYMRAKIDQAPTEISALLDYRHVESKKSSLFHRTPEVNFAPVDPQDQSIPYDAILPLRQKYLNHKLGPHGANAKRALHKAIVEALAVSGWMACEVGYESRTVEIETVQPGMLGQPPTVVKVPVPIWERCFITQIPSKKLLVPDDLHDTDFDAAPWLGTRGVIPLLTARALGWKLPSDFKGAAKKDESIFDHGVDVEGGDDLVPYVKAWYRAAHFDAKVVHPELFRCLILVDGIDEPVKHVDSPYQTLDAQGRLTDDSLIGNPIHVGTLRDLPDSAYVPSDLVVGEQLSMEVNSYRTDQSRNRRARRPRIVTDGLTLEEMEKFTKNEGPIPLAEGKLGGGLERVVAVVGMGSEPRDNYTGQEIMERDYEQALGMSANQSGQFAKSKRTATEVRTVQGNSSARAETEKDRVREYFVGLVRKFDVIEQRYATQQDVQKVLGQAGAQLWEQWKVLPGKYAYEILPDAGQHVDVQQYRSQVLDEYNLLRKDERVNTDDLLKKVARALGYDPATFVAPPQEKQPEPIKQSITFKGEDVLVPASGRLLLDLLTESGIKLSPDTIALMKQAHDAAMAATMMVGAAPAGGSTPVAPDPVGHGGSASLTEPVNQHSSERTGGVTGMGVM